jgi:hypothetical protein
MTTTSRTVFVLTLALTLNLAAQTTRPKGSPFPTNSNPMKYVAWDGTLWSGYVQAVARQVSVDGLGISVIDPDFWHVSGDGKGQDHRDGRMGYIADNGTHWSAWIHSSSEGDHVDLQFEHCPAGCNQGGSCCHKANIIKFRTWGGSCQQGTLSSIGMPDENGRNANVPIKIAYSPIPCD